MIRGVWVLILVLAGAGVVLWGLTIALTLWALLRPPRLTPARAMARLGRMSPSDMGLRHIDRSFVVRRGDRPEGLKIAGWWVPHPMGGGRTVVIVHGYADSRIGALAWLGPWVALGFNALLIDLPAHGESEGTWTTAGLRERHDLAEVIQTLRADQPEATREVFLFGVSLGAAVVLAAAGESDVNGVVIESPVADFARGAGVQLSILGLPTRGVLGPGLWIAQLLIGQRFASIRPTDLIRSLPCPVLAMLPEADPFLPPEDARALASAVEARREIDGVSSCNVFPGAGHLQPLQTDPAGYTNRLNQFSISCKSGRLARATPVTADSGPGRAEVDVDS